MSVLNPISPFWKVLKVVVEVAIVFLLLLAIAFVLANWPVKEKNEEMKFGVSFSHTFARDLGLEWKEVYKEMLDDLGVKKVRLVAYWNEIEKEEGRYDFEYLDWLVEEAEERDAEVVLAFGLKSPRWPECYIPKFYERNKKERQKALLEYEKELIGRYKKYDHIKMWQVENEPFFPFGDCNEKFIDGDLVDREIEQVKQLDGRPVLVTDSGELGIWYRAAKRGDVFGTTLYRTVYRSNMGYVDYPMSPNFFRIKAWMIKLLASQENVIIAELQGEPWGPDWIGAMSIKEQYKSMDPEKFQETIEFAQKTGFSESYLWGVEWWYWLKEKKDKDEMWDLAKDLF